MRSTHATHSTTAKNQVIQELALKRWALKHRDIICIGVSL